ncbi:amidohydrolase (plasmid) [Pseudorhodobacter turbinis]|uniref:Amidohydrolase n=1 Tax=Pseudorhodobacter turbinis TaxID=2500533 RepID=A0A4P8EKW1_9RHOB|nr:amidohydrolase family protein [Pseudorhodobacter turbinis]QCO57677.1 amidohydrolase [Pseudorhodobacter turbinis]
MQSKASPTITAPPTTAFTDVTNGCDCHAHIIGDDSEFPMDPNRSETPATGSLDHWLDKYRTHLAQLGLTRGVIVHSMIYGLDNSITAEAIARLGRDNFRGVALLTSDVSDEVLDYMAEQGFKGARLNYIHGGVLDWEGAKSLAPRLKSRGMHLQILLHTHMHMVEIAPELMRLPCDVVIDHMGWPDTSAGPDEPGFNTFLRSLETGKMWLKLSAPYRLCNSPYREVDSFVTRTLEVNPERCLWGSDWPYLMRGAAKRPEIEDLTEAFLRVVPVSQRQTVLASNPATLFGF